MYNGHVSHRVPLKSFTTLRAGGDAERLVIATHSDELAVASALSQTSGLPTTVLGWGSNVLPSDRGVPGLVIINRTSRIELSSDGEVTADTGCSLQELFLRTAQAGIAGLSFAVGIPGTLGGALVSNAGAYRSSIGKLVSALEVVEDGQRKWVEPSWMQFSYRDSRLRKPERTHAVILRATLQLCPGDRKQIYDEARENQRQRISKQPPGPSAGSFFKNVNDPNLAQRLETLPTGLKEAGVVPAGYLIEACGLKGYRIGGAEFGKRHANFIVNVGDASAFEIGRLAILAKNVVGDKFGVALEEEVLYLGDWSGVG